MMKSLKDDYIDIKIAEKKPELAESKILMGEFHNKPEEEYTEKYQQIIDMLKKER
jgi:hypothetical protein